MLKNIAVVGGFVAAALAAPQEAYGYGSSTSSAPEPSTYEASSSSTPIPSTYEVSSSTSSKSTPSIYTVTTTHSASTYEVSFFDFHQAIDL
nr:hypothetical protein CFP56_46636 [Quercus suber]